MHDMSYNVIAIPAASYYIHPSQVAGMDVLGEVHSLSTYIQLMGLK